MSFRFDGALLAGAYHFGNRGLGVIGALIPSTGLYGPSYIYNDLALPGDASNEYMGRVTSPPPTGAFFAYEDGSFSFVPPGDGIYPFSYRLYENGVDLGLRTSTITSGVVAQASVSITTDPAIFSGVAGQASQAAVNVTTDAAVFNGSAGVLIPGVASVNVTTAAAVFSGRAAGVGASGHIRKIGFSFRAGGSIGFTLN